MSDYSYKQKIVKIDLDERGHKVRKIVHEEVHFMLEGRDCRSMDVAVHFMTTERGYILEDAYEYLKGLEVREFPERRITLDGEVDYWREYADYIAYQKMKPEDRERSNKSRR